MGSTNYNQVIYRYNSVLLWNKCHFMNKYTTLSHWLFFLFGKFWNEFGYLNIDTSKGICFRFGPTSWKIVWNPMNLYSRWIFCGVNFLCLYMAYSGRVSQTFSELFNPKLVLSLYTGIKVLKGSLKVSWCTNHMTVNITLIFTMLEHPG